MLTLDTENHTEEYLDDFKYSQEQYLENDSSDYIADCLVDDFEDFYNNKLAFLTDSLESKADADLNNTDLHPDKRLARFDKDTTGYIDKVIYPFFEEMANHYGSKIWNIYTKDYVNMISDKRQNYITCCYNDDLEDFLAFQKEQEKLKSIEKLILKSLKLTSPQKQADLIKLFDKADQSKAKRIINILIKKGEILRGRKDINSRGVWYLIFIK